MRLTRRRISNICFESKIALPKNQSRAGMLNSFRKPTPEELDYRTMRKGCYQRNCNPQKAYNKFHQKYGYAPPIAWNSHCFFNQNKKMTVPSQLKFARYCLRTTDSADEAIEMMQIEVGIGAKWDEYKLKFLVCVREWESRVSPKIESLHASQGWRYQKFEIYHPVSKKPHHEYLEDNDIYTLNDQVIAWEALSEEEQEAEQEIVKQSLLGRTSPGPQTKEPQADQRKKTYYRSRTRRENSSGYQQQKRFQRNSSKYRKKSVKSESSLKSSSAKFFRDKYSTVAELKTAYRNLSKKFHPDTGGNEEDFKQLLDEYLKLKSQFK